LKLVYTTLVPPFTSVHLTIDIDILFLHNIPTWLKSFLLDAAQLLVYTPTNEHFGIVPVEAQLHSTPVLAIPTGGPLETIQDNLTGFLRPGEQWAMVLDTVLRKGVNPEMGRRGRQRIISEFSREAMADRFERKVVNVVEMTRGMGEGRWLMAWEIWVGWSAVGILLAMIIVQLSR
jgi:alpha-1,3/alpha-1,6-mannosyltransferase